MARQYDVSIIVGLKDQASAGLRRLQATARASFGQLARTAEWSIARVERGLATLGRRALIAGGALAGATGLAVRSVINSFGEYEQSVRNAVTVTGLVGEEARAAERAMFDLGLQLSRTSTFTGPEIAQVFYELASAGLSVKESMQAARGVIALSEGTLSDVGEAAMLVTSQLAAFGLAATETDRVVNVMAATTSATLMKMSDLATALPYVGAVARAMRLDIETTAAALGLLRNNGLDASMAGTALRMMLTGLARQTPQGVKILRRYGLTMQDLDVAAHGLLPTLRRLRAAQISYADAVGLFSVRGVLAYNILTAQVDELAQLKQQITGTNMAYQMQARQLDTVQGRWKVLKSTLAEVAVRIGEGLAPAAKRLLEIMTEALGRGVDIGVFARVAQTIQGLLERLMRWIESGGAARFGAAVGAMMQRGAAMVREFAQRIADDWQAIMARAGAAAGGLYSWLVGGADFPADALGALARAVADGVRQALSTAAEMLGGPEIWAAFRRLLAEAFRLSPGEVDAVVAEWRAILAEVGRSLLAILQGIRQIIPHILAGLGAILRWAGEHPTIAQFGILLAIFQKLTGLLPLMVAGLARIGGWLWRIAGAAEWVGRIATVLRQALLPVLGKIGAKLLGIVGIVISLYDIVRTLLAALGALGAWREAGRKGREVKELLGTRGRLQDVLEAPITPEQLQHARRAMGLPPARGGGLAPAGAAGPALPYRPAGVTVPAPAGPTGPPTIAVNVRVDAPVYGVDDLEQKIKAIASRQVQAALAGVV